ncbi:MAG: GNAT family N-acetyltransferase [bacterium]|nr:GNAT family N-acetyltransferase [bacterium]
MITQKIFTSEAIKFIFEKDGQVAGRAYLYLITNDLHEQCYGLVEDLFVDDKWRGQGIGTELLTAVMVEARKRKCYKLIGTSRTARAEVHEWYERLGFKKYGVEFRMDL